jgi:hypothetical protein
MGRYDQQLPLPRLLSRGLEAAWRAGVATRPPLHSGAIVAAASKVARGEPSDGPWRERLDLLCGALRDEAALNSLGRTIAFGQLVRIVAARARAERLWAERSEIRERPLGPPLVIVGQMRSGTTRLHRLLACDPAFAHTRTFESLEPVPPRGLDVRRLKARAGLGFLAVCNPALRAIHPTSATAPEEEFGLHAFSLWGAQFEGQWFVPTFARACEAGDAGGIYAEFASLLRTIGWARGDPPGKPWLLKAPQFAQDLEALAAAFPDARFLRLHRAPAEIVASSASLAWQQARVQSDCADRAAIGREWLRKTQLREERMRILFDGRSDALHLDYAEVGTDWRGAIRRIYSFLGRPLEPVVLERMDRLTERSKAHRGHDYSLGQFGLDPDEVAAALA